MSSKFGSVFLETTKYKSLSCDLDVSFHAAVTEGRSPALKPVEWKVAPFCRLRKKYFGLNFLFQCVCFWRNSNSPLPIMYTSCEHLENIFHHHCCKQTAFHLPLKRKIPNKFYINVMHKLMTPVNYLMLLNFQT